jgi:hypothetical protein
VDGLFVEFPDQANQIIEQMLQADQRHYAIDNASADMGAAGEFDETELEREERQREEEESRRVCLRNRKARACSMDLTGIPPLPKWLRPPPRATTA